MHGHRDRTPTHRPGRQRPWTLLVLLALAQFMVILDVTVVNVALPSIGADLGFGGNDLSWVITAYVLMTGGLMLLGGRAGDLLGHRGVFLAGTAIFTAASLGSGLASSSAMLIAFRAVQGGGAALMVPSALALLTIAYEGAQRTTALAVWGALGSAGAAAGVLLGGLITTLLGWQWIFFVNLPVGLAVGALVPRFAPGIRSHECGNPEHAAGRPAGFDLRGAAIAIAGLVCAVLAIQGAPEHGWDSARTVLLLAAAVVLLAGFGLAERRASDPLVPPSTWRRRSLVAGTGLMLGATAALVGVFLLNTLYMQQVLGYSALETGLAFLPLALVTGVAAHVASRLLPGFGTRATAASGLVLLGAGSLLLASAPDRAAYLTELLPGLLILGFGIGMAFVSVSVAAMSEVGHQSAGLASGLMTTAHELGAAFGAAVAGAIAIGDSEAITPGGYGSGAIATAALAGALALLALIALPSVRPAPGARVAMH